VKPQSGEAQQVALASPTGLLVLRNPIFDRDLIRERSLIDRAERDRFAHVSTVHDGKRLDDLPVVPRP